MPLYDYKCEDCDFVKERIDYLNDVFDSPVYACPLCGGVMRRKQPSPGLLKGKGYTTIMRAERESDD